MHLLAATPGRATTADEPIDLRQSPGDIVVLSAADTDLACLAAAHAAIRVRSGAAPSLRLANLMQLTHNLSVDLHVDAVIAEARLVIVRLIGGVGYWPYGIEQIAAAARRGSILLAVVPGDDRPDPLLMAHSTLPDAEVARIWAYLTHGGPANAVALLDRAAALLGYPTGWAEPAPLPQAGLYLRGAGMIGLDEVRAAWTPRDPVCAILFYRALLQAGNLRAVDALADAIAGRGMNPLAIHVSSLKDPVSADLVERLLAETDASVILNATGFAVSRPGGERTATCFDGADCPVIQVIFSGSDRASWEKSPAGLSARDVAMNVALPEVDGRIVSRAVSFKAETRFDPATECSIVGYDPEPGRVGFVAELAARWVRLRRTPARDRRIALILANYPNRDSRIGNGVGLDTPASVLAILNALAGSGYEVGTIPSDTDALMRGVVSAPTNQRPVASAPREAVTWPLAGYRAYFAGLPGAVREGISRQWGDPACDPFVVGDEFVLPVHRFGNCLVAVQPARGYNIDPVATYHDPALPPPHGYLAFYAWLRLAFDTHAVVHVGKHGNLEWLPGKAVALSPDCYPEAALGPLPNLYPFIVNDPGEGTQAKRRSAAVVVDHLTPPLTRAETYGPLRELEALVDEYYEAAALDPRRLGPLGEAILDRLQRLRLDIDCGIVAGDGDAERLRKLDAWLCELKELQIRDGLHVFGAVPCGRQLDDLLTALVRVPRGTGDGGDASLQRSLAADLRLGPFDPLDCDMAEPWTGPRPAVLAGLDTASQWRTAGDTVERLECLASRLVSGEGKPDPGWARSRAVLQCLATSIRPSVDASGTAELDGLLAGLAGRFVPPGPSGAPTRGRPEVLPTGRNFYSVDTRAVPTPAAWQLGWEAAGLVLERYRQDHGAWPRTLALSAWGTANMRTGGDDIAQVLALMGTRPRWETGSGRVTGFEILPLGVLDRPRVDVTLRISGFFRDAFAAQIALVDGAARAVAALDEPAELNPLAANVAAEAARMASDGGEPDDARHRAGFRVFGSRPGAYGAGLQALIDEGIWSDAGDLASAYLEWGGYAYGAGGDGEAGHGLFRARLENTELVLHNQDNREHDLLDSDDYYQFEGGLAVAVRHYSGRAPASYHGDHSRPGALRIRSLEQEVARVVRGRVVNPKWIAGIMRHGYRGGAELAATVDYLFAFAATARCVGDHHFDAVFDAYLENGDVRRFLRRHNPRALADIAARLLEARSRGLWRPARNRVVGRLERIAAG